ncbi:hypothetical protein A3709_19620 [Halioglobus sp. HI00S01]|uniref:hypothetical protein n=1 Tax=Halioglobus sp. HI00S01 TaxID=1822214 RepID=UPI0007C3458C|nr:hypothetical protein [Halioglobus sp. HI00S01]KZX57835.1 hypothetical protein A3709_19620 [Halioglobus sp. HI00S01]
MRNILGKTIATTAVLVCAAFAPHHSAAQTGCDRCIEGAVDSANDAISAALTATRNNLLIQTTLLEQTIGSAAISIATEFEKTGIAREALFKDLTLKIIDAIDKQPLQLDAHRVEYDYGENAQPLSLNVHAERAPYLKTAWAEQREVLAEAQRKMRDHINASSSRSATSLLEAALAYDNDGVDISSMITKRQLTLGESKSVMDQLMIAIEPDPKTPMLDEEWKTSDAAANYELQRRRDVAAKMFAFGVLAETLAESQPSIQRDNTNWPHTYANTPPVEDGKISWRAFLHDEAHGRLVSNSWYNDLRILNRTGLMRESVILSAVRNAMLARQVQREEQMTMMMAMDLARDTQ